MAPALAPAEKQKNYRERKRSQHVLSFETTAASLYVTCSCGKFRKRLLKATTPREAAAFGREHERDVAVINKYAK